FAISSSFIALVEGVRKKLSIDKICTAINMISGCQYGNSTIFYEIGKIDIPLKGLAYKNINRIQYNEKNHPKNYKSRYKAVEDQLLENRKLFSEINKYNGEDECVDIGLSGGFDSRMLISLSVEAFKNISVHSNYKNPPDADLKISRAIASQIRTKLKEIKITPTCDMTDKKLNNNLHKAFLFYDGQIRTNHGWTREYRTLDHRKEILGNCVLGISGHNGEQYRNDYYFIRKNIHIKKFISEYVFEGKLKYCVSDKNDRKTLTIFFENYFRRKLDLNDSQFLSLNDLRIFYSKEWVTCGPGIRASIENQLSEFIMPFTDKIVTTSASNIHEFIGVFGKFQLMMIKEINETLAKISSNYGYNFMRIPVKYRIKAILRGLLGMKLVNKIRIYKKSTKKQKLYSNNPVNFDLLNGTGLTVRWEQIYSLGEHERDRLTALSYLLERYKQKIDFKK
ncbi:MAG: hypothetical protein K8R79_07020, partial [Calditrichales bacterium]|nr:hypothetical protein [Calditrichales bacterium]